MTIDLRFLKQLGVAGTSPGAYDGTWRRPRGARFDVRTPIDGSRIGSVTSASRADYERVAAAAHATFERWREVPAPRRGELVRRIGEALRRDKLQLGKLVTLETGKILEEGFGEVQECIDIADFAVGLSRQLYGLTMKSERPRHAMRETWHPLGPVGVITAFNFPAAVWAWNAMIALVCGDTLIWKPSRKTPLTALALTRIAAGVLEPEGFGAACSLVIGGDEEVAGALLDDRRVPLISMTGSTRVGKLVAKRVGERLGRTILELGGNNAIVVLDDADLDMATRSIVFGSVGTAGQRCTSTRRLLVQKGVRKELEKRLVRAYRQLRIGDPFAKRTVVGPLIDASARDAMAKAIAAARAAGGEVLCGGGPAKVPKALAGGAYVEPAIVRMERQSEVVCEETFAPILYVLEVKDLDEALALHNAVPQGLTSAIFTLSVRSAERFLGEAGSDCGIANVNLGTSGAEIGGAFGGEKETGGGRESGSDSWKAYMRRQTSTINWGNELPLAQGIRFGQ